MNMRRCKFIIDFNRSCFDLFPVQRDADIYCESHRASFARFKAKVAECDIKAGKCLVCGSTNGHKFSCGRAR